MEKTYLCIVEPGGVPERGTIDLPLTTGRKNRVRVAAQREAIVRREDAWYVDQPNTGKGRVYPSITRFSRLWEGEGRALLAVRPVTGRRHQIRVHLAWIGHPIVGDPLFAGKGASGARTLLHSWRLAFDGLDGSRVTVEAPLGAGFLAGLSLGKGEVAALLERARSG